MALVSADSRVAELLGERVELIKQTQVGCSYSEHNLVNMQKKHEWVQTENKICPYYWTKLQELYTTDKAHRRGQMQGVLLAASYAKCWIKSLR